MGLVGVVRPVHQILLVACLAMCGTDGLFVDVDGVFVL